MIAVLMMFKDEEDIIGKCIEHWAGLGVDKFYLCNNNSKDKSQDIIMSKVTEIDFKLYGSFESNFPQRKVINELKAMAIRDGHQWLFPIDADEFLNMGVRYESIQDFVKDHEFRPKYFACSYRYKNIMPNGNRWFEPKHEKVFGKLNPDWNISIGNHQIEDHSIYFDIQIIWLDHYQYRSYDQFKRKKLTFFKAFEKAGYLDHKFVKEYRLYQKHGEAYLEQMWDYLLRGVTDFEFKPHAQ